MKKSVELKTWLTLEKQSDRKHGDGTFTLYRDKHILLPITSTDIRVEKGLIKTEYYVNTPTWHIACPIEISE